MTREKQVVSGQLNLPGVVEAQCSNRIDSVFDVTPEQVEASEKCQTETLRAGVWTHRLRQWSALF